MDMHLFQFQHKEFAGNKKKTSKSAREKSGIYYVNLTIKVVTPLVDPWTVKLKTLWRYAL